jgi:quercetin dioxygenase-like cupin family protein
MRKIGWFSGIIILSLLSMASRKWLNSSVYEWEKLPVKKTPSGELKNFLKSPTRSLEMFEISAITLYVDKEKWTSKVEKGTDELIIIKEGAADIQINNEKKTLGEGSVIVAGQNDEVIVSNKNNSNTVFYLIRFKPFHDKNTAGILPEVAPLFIDWNNVEYKTTGNGGRRSIMQQKTSVLKELEIHVTTLKEGLPSHAAHTHPDEEIILVRKGSVEETIKEEHFRMGPGSIIFLTNDDMHGIANAGTGECEYFAIRWLTGQTRLGTSDIQ